MSANYYEVTNRIAEVIAKTTRDPLTSDQRLALAGAIGVELAREFQRGRKYTADNPSKAA